MLHLPHRFTMRERRKKRRKTHNNTVCMHQEERERKRERARLTHRQLIDTKLFVPHTELECYTKMLNAYDAIPFRDHSEWANIFIPLLSFTRVVYFVTAERLYLCGSCSMIKKKKGWRHSRHLFVYYLFFIYLGTHIRHKNVANKRETVGISLNWLFGFGELWASISSLLEDVEEWGRR